MSSNTSVPTIGNASKLGEYKLVRNVGEGTFGKVKLAIHTVTGHKVAMKFISKAKINAMKMRTRVSREVEYLRMLRHPHIIKLYEVISTPTDIIMVIEYAGGELFNYIVEHGKMSEPAARKFFQQIMFAISYSHALKIVHRDLKPENVLLDENLNVKIVDFGLSNIMTDGDFLKTSCGSPNYAAPEVISGKLYAGPEIDVWSCGVILYVMLCGRLPFEDENVPQLFHKISNGIYHIPSYLSPDAKSIIAGMLAVDPVKRLTVPEILNLPWFNVDLAPYLRPPPQSGPFLGTLSSLLAPNDDSRGDVVRGLGRIDQTVVAELANSLGVSKEEIEEAICKENDNAVRVAYMLCKDRRRAGRALSDLDSDERGPQEPTVEPFWHPGFGEILVPPRPTAIPSRARGVSGHFDKEDFEDEDDEDDEDDDDEEFGLNEIDWTEENNFAVLDSSLVGPQQAPVQSGPLSHHLTDYASARTPAPPNPRPRSGPPPPSTSSRKQASHPHASASKQPRWHFGIRSRSPPMEVMLEIYQTLKALGMEWKEKGGQWGLGVGEDRQERDDDENNFSKEALDIYFVETRCRIREVVVRMDLQLYQVDAANYLVDFRNKGYYKADLNTTAQFNRIVRQRRPRSPGSPGGPRENANGRSSDVATHGRLERGASDLADIAESPSTSLSRRNSEASGSTFSGVSEASKDLDKGIVDVSSPFLFLECACRLIVELAGG